jgi:hypothetical protein
MVVQMQRLPVGSEELVVYRVASAVLAAPLAHPATLLLWRLLLHLYLQRPPCDRLLLPYYPKIPTYRTFKQIRKYFKYYVQENTLKKYMTKELFFYLLPVSVTSLL